MNYCEECKKPFDTEPVKAPWADSCFCSQECVDKREEAVDAAYEDSRDYNEAWEGKN
jgi:hypothetical protein